MAGPCLLCSGHSTTRKTGKVPDSSDPALHSSGRASGAVVFSTAVGKVKWLIQSPNSEQIFQTPEQKHTATQTPAKLQIVPNLNLAVQAGLQKQQSTAQQFQTVPNLNLAVQAGLQKQQSTAQQPAK